MNAYEGMVAILDANETIEELRKQNTGDKPDMLNCKIQTLLGQYRTLLVEEMKATTLEVFRHDD